jgi:HK97 gp10 family phage protein
MSIQTSSAATRAAMDKELRRASKILNDLVKDLSVKERRKILRQSAKILQKAAKANIPQSDAEHFRYATNKISKSMRTPKGLGNVVAVYHPGNLRRAIRTLTFRRSSAVFVGPKLAKKSSYGVFRGGRVDGYYAHFMEFGTRNFSGLGYMRRAVDATANQVLKDMVNRFTVYINKSIKSKAA